jgi:electron transfer DM13
MLRSRAVRGAAIVAGIVLVIVGWYLGSPLFIRTSANEATPSAASQVTPSPSMNEPFPRETLGSIGPTPRVVATIDVARGELQFVDSLHNGKGPVILLRVGDRHVLRFENVAITNAPDVHVYLSRDRGGKWTESTSLYLGPLKATNGSFNYDVPAGTDVAPFKSVVVWCRAFSVLVTWADLTAV